MMNKNITWEQTFVMIKPDGVKRALIGRIISRFERAGLTLAGMKMVEVNTELAEKHYEIHREKPFFIPLVSLLTSGPVIAMVFEGAHAISVVRKIVGATEPLEAAPGSIRGDFCHMSYSRSKERLGVIPNLIHASDSAESAETELTLWFKPEDYAEDYSRSDAEFM